MEKIEVIVRGAKGYGQRELTRFKKRFLADIAKGTDLTLTEVESASGKGLAVLLVLTDGVERAVLKQASQLPSPTLLIAHSDYSSLPASLEILARIRQDGGEGRILFGSPEEIAEELSRERRITAAWERLRFSRVGIIGGMADRTLAGEVDRAFLKGRLDVQLVEIERADWEKAIEGASSSKRELSRLVKGAESVATLTDEDLQRAVLFYDALNTLVQSHRLSACTVRCSDLVDRTEGTCCYAVSRMNDEEIPAGCEGDLQALFSLYVGYLLAGRVGFTGSLISVDVERHEVMMSHSTCPLSVASRYALCRPRHFDVGVGIAAEIAEGPCTLFRLGGTRLDRLFLGEGFIEERSQEADLCCTQLSLSIESPLDSLLIAPLGSRHILLPGHHREAIERFFTRFLAA